MPPDRLWRTPPARPRLDPRAFTTYNGVASTSCSLGFTLSGSAQRTCQADGTWSGTAGTCSTTLLKLTLNSAGSGLGTISIQPTTPLTCATVCEGKVAYNTAVTLTATPNQGQSFVGWDGPTCKGKSTCTFTITSDTTVSAIFSPPSNIVFVTSTEHTGDLGGLAGADAICMARAAAAHLEGTYKAWLSTGTVSAKSRMGNASGWARPDGKPVLSLLSDLESDKVLYPPCLDESGNNLGDAWTRTGTDRNGAKRVDSQYVTCGDYTSAIDDASKYVMAGFASSDSSGFTASNVIGCSMPTHILCFGNNRAAFVAPDPTTPGRRAFSTNADWTPGGGLASADALCQKEAGDAGLTGTFKALLAPTGATAASRFTGSEAWHRMDGLPLAATADAFLTGSTFDVAPNMTAKGDHLQRVTIWAGAASTSTAGADAGNCNNWLSSTSTAQPSMGECDSTTARRFFGMGTPIRCGNPARLVCLQN